MHALSYDGFENNVKLGQGEFIRNSTSVWKLFSYLKTVNKDRSFMFNGKIET